MASNAVVHPKPPEQPALGLCLLWLIVLMIYALVRPFVDEKSSEEEKEQMRLFMKQVREEIWVIFCRYFKLINVFDQSVCEPQTTTFFMVDKCLQ